MNAIQITLTVLVVVGVVLIMRGQGTRHQAIRRLGLLVFALLTIAAIAFPDTLTLMANTMGVERGTDLLLYIHVMVFFAYVATRYFREKRQNHNLTVLARQLALALAPPHMEPTERPNQPPETAP